MKMHRKIITLLAFSTIVCIMSCTQVNRNKQGGSDKNDSIGYEVDTSRIAILPLSPFIPFSIFKDTTPAELILEEYKEVDNLLKKCIIDYNNTQTPNNQIDIVNYYRQYIVVLNSEGEKEVWVNCLCKFFAHDWKQKIIITIDGGKCFFNLKINLTKKQYYDLRVNGYA